MRRIDKLRKAFPFMAYFHVYRVSVAGWIIRCSCCWRAAVAIAWIMWRKQNT